MEELLDVLQGTAICTFVIFFIKYIKSRLIFPIRTGKNIEVFAVLRVRGSAPELEGAIRGLDGITEEGKMKIFIVDCGMDDDTKRLAGIIEKSDQTKKLMSEEEFSCVWRR